MESKDKGSRTGSRTNLNESTLPLLEDQEMEKGETPEKEKIELDTRSEEKEDEGKEKSDGGDDQSDQKEIEEKNGESEGEKKSKKKKQKEKKDKTKTHRRTISCAEKLTIGMNLLDRDEKHVNDHVNLVFEDVIAEPDSTQGFDAIWRLAYIVFTGTKFWVYRIIAALLALPCGIFWGFTFSILTLVHVWLVTPTLRSLEIVLHIFRTIWTSLVRTILDPFFQSAANLFSGISIVKRTTQEHSLKEP